MDTSIVGASAGVFPRVKEEPSLRVYETGCDDGFPLSRE